MGKDFSSALRPAIVMTILFAALLGLAYPLAMTGIGIDKAFRIWFRANTTKFTASTNYADARAKMIEAAGELSVQLGLA